MVSRKSCPLVLLSTRIFLVSSSFDQVDPTDFAGQFAQLFIREIHSR